MIIGQLNYYIVGEVVACILSMVLCSNILLTFTASERKQRLFLYAGIGSFLNSFIDIFAVFCITYYNKLPLRLCTAVSTLFFIFLIFVPFALNCFTIEVAMEFKGNKRLFYIIAGNVYTIYFFILLFNIKFGLVFSYDPVLGYVKGPLKNITYIMTVFFMVMNVALSIRNRKSLARQVFWIFVTYPVVCFIMMALQFFVPRAIMTGASSFTALLMAYLTIQSDMREFDSVTGLLCEAKLQNHLSKKRSPGFLYVLHIENLNFIENNTAVQDKNQLLLDIGKEFLACFERRSYSISDNRFAGICDTKDELLRMESRVRQFITKVNQNEEYNLPMALECYTAAIEFTNKDTEKTYSNIIEILNSLVEKAKNNLSSELQLSDERILIDMERKKCIYKILKRELTLESKQYQVYFQPIYSIEKGKFTYMEALSRLTGTEMGDIPPGEFVEVAERRGLIEKLGFVAFEKVCKFIAENRELVDAVSINFSVYQMTNPKLVETVLSTIKRFNLSPSNIIMEITESIFIDDYEMVFKNMTELANAGVMFYLDDFGTGYSNLSNVVTLPFKTIKMDRSLVLMMEDSQKNITLFNNLVSTFKGAGLHILVEGVETQTQDKLVKEAGVEFIQGFLYSRPLPPEKCIEVLSNQ